MADETEQEKRAAMLEARRIYAELLEHHCPGILLFLRQMKQKGYPLTPLMLTTSDGQVITLQQIYRGQLQARKTQTICQESETV